MKRWVRDTFVIVGAFGATTASGVALSGLSGREKPIQYAESFAPTRYELNTQVVHDSLSPAVKTYLARSGKRGPLVAILLRERDIARCEDLGRQLRELSRASGEVSIEIWTDSGSLPTVETFVRMERLTSASTRVLQLASVLADALQPPVTPAVLLISHDYRVTAGIAHPGRFANARPLSFAHELADGLKQLSDTPETR